MKMQQQDQQSRLQRSQSHVNEIIINKQNLTQYKIATILLFFVYVCTSFLNLQFYLRLWDRSTGKQMNVSASAYANVSIPTSQNLQTSHDSIWQQVQIMYKSIGYYTNSAYQNDQTTQNRPNTTQNKHNLALTQRIPLGSPSTPPSSLKVITMTQSNPKSTLCFLTNGINIITNTTINSVEQMFSETNFYKWILFMDSNDHISNKLVNQLHTRIGAKFGIQLESKNVDVDSQYRYVRDAVEGCGDVVYGQGEFGVRGKHLGDVNMLLDKYKDHVLFSFVVSKNQKNIQLADLNKANLQQITEKDLNSYIFIFPAYYLQYITPLNYAFYAKYTINQLIINPILAIAQGSGKLIGFRTLLHTVNRQYASGKYFSLKQVKLQNKKGVKQEGFCFVSYPTQSNIVNYQQFKIYFQSLTQIAGIQDSTIIINVPYRYDSTSSQIFKIFELIHKSQLQHIRLRIRSNKTVSSLSCYQATYSYCPDPSFIISSRHNIQLNPNFLTQLNKKTNVQFHYYQSAFTIAQQQSVSPNIAGSNYRKLRQNMLYFRQYFMHLQIFRMNLFKMMYFWILKCEELDFYDTQASFVIPMLEMVRMNVRVISTPLFNVVKLREIGSVQKQQIQSLKLYLQWTPIPAGKLLPYRLNSLQNQAFKRNAVEKIPKNLHQVWLGKKQITPFQQKLHNTLIQTNPDFKMHLWRDQNITIQNFPLTYSLIKRSIQYQKYSTRSYSAPTVSLIRYEILYRIGGIYIDFKTQGKKKLNNFLKYQMFFIDVDYEQNHYYEPKNVGNGIIGAMRNCYTFFLVLSQLISQEKFDFKMTDFPKIVGGFVLRKALTDKELFQVAGYGFQLFSQKPGTGKPNLCSTNNFVAKQGKQIFNVADHQSGKMFSISIPCDIYKQSYLVMYKVLAGTWKVKKQQTRNLHSSKYEIPT